MRKEKETVKRRRKTERGEISRQRREKPWEDGRREKLNE